MTNIQTVNNFLQNLGFKKIVNNSPEFHYYTHQETKKQVKIDRELETFTLIDKAGFTDSYYDLFSPDMKSTESIIKKFLKK